MSTQLADQRRQWCERCIDICSGVILSMVQKLGREQLADERLEILLASMVRAVNTSAAIRHLWTDRPFAEEMGVLVRSLAEGMINATYLQIADHLEVDSFVRFDTIALAKTLHFADELKPASMPGVRTDLRTAFEEKAEAVKRELANTVSATSWTKRDLHSRATAVDNATSTTLMTFLSRMMYRHGHTYTHATYSSLAYAISALRTGVYAEEDVLGAAEHHLLMTGQSLYAFALALILLKKVPGLDEALSEVPHILDMYNDSL